jgi:hypothetical protein
VVCSGQRVVCSVQRVVCSGQRVVCSGQRVVCSGQRVVCSGQRVVSSVKTMVATGWTVRGLNPVGGKFFRTRPDRPRGPLIFLYIGYFGSFPWLRRPGRGVNHPPCLTPSLKRVELCLYSRLCLYDMLLGDLYLYRSEKVGFLLDHFCITYSRRVSK